MNFTIDNYEAVFFDLFHTLISFVSEGTPGRKTSEILGVDEADWSDAAFHRSDDRLRGKVNDPYKTIGDLARLIDPDIPDEVIRDATDNRNRRFRNCLMNVSSERVRILETLRDRGKKICLISNADPFEVSAWPDSPLSRVFHETIFSYQVGYVKPEKEIYLEGLKRLSVTPEASLFVGDGSNSELQGAKNAGMTTVLTIEIIRNKWPDRIEERKKHADHVIEKLEELII